MPSDHDLMALHQLEYFAVVVEEKSFTRAAHRLSISQPALSRQIAVLERRLGTKLLERTPAGPIPTVCGRAILPEAVSALAAARRVVRSAKQASHLNGGVLEIATFPGLATGTLLPAIRRWHVLHRGVALQLREFRQRSALQEAVRTGTADLAIGSPPIAWDGPVRKVGWNEMVVVLPLGDALLKQPGAIKLSALANRSWVLYERAYGLSDVVTAACVKGGFTPHCAIETSQVEAAARLAAAGLGPALVPAMNVPRELAALARRIKPRVVWDIVAYSRVNWSPTALRFLEVVAQDKQPEAPLNALRWVAS